MTFKYNVLTYLMGEGPVRKFEGQLYKNYI